MGSRQDFWKGEVQNLREKLFHTKSQQINRGNKFINEVLGAAAPIPGSRLRGPAVQCSADRRGHTEGGRAAPEKFHLSGPKGQKGSGRSIKTAVIPSSLQPHPTPQSLPKKLTPRSRADPAPAPRRAAAPAPRPPEPLDSSLAAPARRRAPLLLCAPGCPSRRRSAGTGCSAAGDARVPGPRPLLACSVRAPSSPSRWPGSE